MTAVVLSIYGAIACYHLGRIADYLKRIAQELKDKE